MGSTEQSPLFIPTTAKVVEIAVERAAAGYGAPHGACGARAGPSWRLLHWYMKIRVVSVDRHEHLLQGLLEVNTQPGIIQLLLVGRCC